ncbi:MAG TPA: hypothetical protein VEQ59_11710 [Polyangiaceae bacterium]|nr:hypothetical protein [Polyangiaceae bacterium]
MFGTTWLSYFEGNTREDRAPAATLAAEVPRELHAALAVSLGRFQLGESAGGRLHEDIVAHRDPSLDAALRRSVQLYIEEEWRHSRELSLLVRGLGGELQTAHWTNGAFTACRRLLGLKTKMMTLAVAEVIGIVYYRALANGVGSAALATSLQRIANEEAAHLDFQAAFFDHAVAHQPRALRAAYRWLLRALMLAIFTTAVAVLLLDHGRVLRRAGARPASLTAAAWRELSTRRFLAAGRLAALARPRYALVHEP